MNRQNLISVGVPVYNAEKTISRCLDSIINQSYSNLEIIISDNNSTDRTLEICKSYADVDSRIILIKQESNIGPARNFAYVLERSRGTYFCWVASDDMRSADFLQLNHEFLANNPEAAASTSPHEFLVNSSESILGKSLSLCGEFDFRVGKFLSDPWNSHALFYSLYKKEKLQDYPKLGENFLGWDWAIIFYVSLFGNFHRINQGMISLESGGQSNRHDALRMSGVKGVKYLYPLSNFVFFVLITTWRKKPSLLLQELKPLTFLSLRILRYEYQLLKHKLKLQVESITSIVK